MRIVRFIITVLLLGLSVEVTAQVGCVPVTLPWNEDFDSCGTGDYAMPPCWSTSHNYDLGAVPHVDATLHYNGSASLMLYSGSLTGSHYSMAIGPEMDADLASGLFLRFRFHAASTAVALEVGICDDTNRYTRNFVPLDTIHADQGGQWKEVVLDLSTYSGTGRHPAFRLQRALQSEPSECHIDNLRLEGCGTTLPRVYHIGYNSLIVDWERHGAGAISLEYNGVTVSDAVAPLTVTGLTPETEYTFSVGCTGDERQEVTVTTLAAPSLTTTYYRDHLTLTVAGDSTLEVLPLPMEDIDINQLTMILRLQGDTATRLVAGVMEYGGEVESFTPIDTLHPGSSWQRHVIRLASYSGTGRYITLLATGQGTVNINDLRLAHCLIDSVRLYDLSDTSVTVAWDTVESGEPATVTIEYGPTGFAAGSGTVVTATTNPFVLNNLETSTVYDLLVAPACGDSPSAYDRHTIITFSHEMSVPYCMPFEEEGTLPQGWVCGQGSASIAATYYEGSHGLRLAAHSVVALPRIRTSDNDTVTLEFYSYGTGTMEVGFMANPFSTFNPADTLTGGNSWRRQLTQLVIPEGYLLALRSNTAWNIDALSVHRNTVVATTIDAIGQSTARVSWQTLRSDSVEVEYKAVASATADFTPGTGTLRRALDSLTLNDLTPGTFYAIHLRPVTDGEGCLHQTCRLQTAAEFQAVPYCENFDNLSAMPASWRRLSDYGEYPIVSAERNRSPNKALRFSATQTAKTIALLPDFVGGSEHMTLAFWTNVTLGLPGAMLLVGHLGDIADMNTFVPQDTILFSQTEHWEHHLVDLGSSHGQVALMLVGGGSGETRLFVDDLCVEPCLADRIRISSVDSSSLTVWWDSYGAAALDITTSGNGMTQRDTFATPPALITGLEPNTPYSFTFRTLCECGGNGGAYYSGYGSDGEVSNDQITSTSIQTSPGIVSIPLCEGFEGLNTGLFPYNWLRKPNRAAVSDRNYHNGSHSLMVNDSCYIVLPTMENVAALTMSLHAYASNETGLGEGVITIGVMQNRDSLESFESVDTLILTRPGEWQRLWGDLTNYSGTGHFVTLKIKASGSCTFFLDDLNVSTCGIGNAEVDETGTVSWESLHGPTQIAIEYGIQGFSRGSGQQDTATAPPYTLENLTAGGNYDVYLTPICGVKPNCQATKLTIGATASTPYCEEFEAAPLSGMPSGWTMGRTYGETPAIDNSNSHCLRLRGHASATYRSIAVLPMLSTHDTLQLALSLRAASTNARLVVGHIGTNADPNTFQATDTLEATTIGQWQRMTAAVTMPEQRKLAISCLSVNQSDAQVWIDSLSITRGFSPTLAATSARTLVINGNNGYFEYGPAHFIQGTGTLIHLEGGELTLSGLSPETEYWFYTREDSLTMTCMPPNKILMPAETTLPYCQGDTLVDRLQLPELAIDSIQHLQLYLDVDGACQLLVGVMERDGDWAHMTAVDTFNVPSGIRKQLHVTFENYNGNGRFVGLLSLSGNVAVRSLTATECPWLTLEERDDNSVMLSGNGDMEYGPTGFAVGEGTAVTVNGSLTVTLPDTARYDFYPLCHSALPCYAPMQIQSSLEVPLPYCAPLSNGLPLGWTSYSNALNSNAIQVTGGNLTMVAAPNRNVIVKMPIMEEQSVVVDMEVRLSGNGILLLLGDDTIEATPNEWQRVRLRTIHNGRLTFSVLGNGTATIRNIEVASCALPRELTVGQPGGRGVELTWDTLGTDSPFFIEYRLAGNATGVTVSATEPPLVLQLLPDTSYSLYLKCDSLGSTCHAPQVVTTLSDPLDLPYCTSFDIDNLHPVPEGWYSVGDNGEHFLVMPQFDISSLQSLNVLLLIQMQHTRQALTLGAMSDAGRPETFDSLTTFMAENNDTNRFFHSLAHYHGNGQFLAFRVDGNGWVRVQHLSVDSCAAYNFVMTETESDHIVLEWEQQGSPLVSVEYGPAGFAAGTGTVVTATESPLRIDSLAPLTDYAFFVSSRCDSASCRDADIDSFFTFIPRGGTGCIDYTDLHASYVSCKYGSFSNPTEFTGIIDRGYQSVASRHTIHFDTTERDARTGYLLRTIPPGEQASVRLGNWSSNINPQSESITYALTIDTNNFTLLVLRYAAVLQDPEHSADLQPRFRLQILNQNNEIIDACSAADFIANPSLNWNIAANDVLWKDWTTVGVDLTPYAGQTIFIRLITNDCGEGSHFGYAYFTLGCSSKQMRTEGCSDVPDNRFTVPQGFNYRWYTNQDTTTISDSSSLWVPSDNNLIYYCQLSFIDKPECHFTMSAFAGARYPLSIIDTSLLVANCEFDLTLFNHSTISGDGIHPVGTGESCETGVWLLPDSSISTNATLSFHFTDTGLFNIALVAGIADGQCLDTLQRTIHIAYPHPPVTLTGRTERCFDDPPEVLTLSNAAFSDWEDHQLTITPPADTILTVGATDSNGCLHTLSHSLVVHPIFLFEDSITTCSSNLSHTWRDTVLSFTLADTLVTATLRRQSVHGCDSIMTLALSLWPSYDIFHSDTLCDNQTFYYFDTTINTPGIYLHSDTTLHGCDSLVTMQLTMMPTYLVTDSIEACDSLRWQDGILYTTDTNGANLTLHTIHNCDSIIHLNLRIHPSFHFFHTDSVCNSLPSYAWLDTLLTLSDIDPSVEATLLRHTIHSCDSIHTLLLTLMPSYYIHHRDTLCQDISLPFFDTTLATTGEYLHTDTTGFGCDSLVTMHLQIIPRSFNNDSIVVCDSLTWVNHITYYHDTAGIVDTLATMRGCDSVVTLYLTVNHSTYNMAIDTFCQGNQYQFRNHTFTDGGYYADTIATVKGCDSVMAIQLTRLDTPVLSISHDYDCDTLYHHLQAQSDVPYLLWTSTPYDSLLENHEHDRIIHVNPRSLTTYTLYADYTADPRCPATTDISLIPMTKPEAEMKVLPSALMLPATEFNAYDVGLEYQERAWYLNGILQGEHSRHLHAYAPTDKDTTRVTLVVGDGHCSDSAVALLPLLYSTLAAPNAFTPDCDNNNLFLIRGIGILKAELRIYNRRGMLVFHTDDFNQPWDGRSLTGEPCPSGSYVWHLRYSSVVRPGAYKEEKGAVLLIR